MKILIRVFVFIIFLSFFPSWSFASSGSAVIPYFFKTHKSTCQLHVTNTSSEAVYVQVHLFNTDGKLIKENITFAYGFSKNPVKQQTLLASKNMGMISINPGNPGPGYGRIDWKSNSTNTVKALVAYVHCFIRVDGVTGQVSIPINGSNLF